MHPGRVVLCCALVALAGCRCGSRDAEEKQKPRFMSKRDKVRKPQQSKYLSASCILVAYKGAQHAPASVKRDKAEAQRLARDLAERLQKDPVLFRDLARKHSDGPNRGVAGDMGSWVRGAGNPEVERVVAKLAIGAVSDPVETDRGFHVLKRQIAVFSALQILVSYRGAQGAPNTATRNRKQAKAEADRLYTELEAHPARFPFLAKKHSDDGPSARVNGRLGVWRRGRRPKVIEWALDRLEIGEVAAPVETPRGFHLLRREDPYPNQ